MATGKSMNSFTNTAGEQQSACRPDKGARWLESAKLKALSEVAKRRAAAVLHPVY
jgi:hypothetical protein